MRLDLTGKNVFITGGTGSVGVALIETFSEANGRVFFQYHSNSKKASILKKKFGCECISLDFSNLNSGDLPQVNFDIVINNAAVNLTKLKMADISDAEWQKTLAINLFSPFLISKKYIPGMIKNKWGRIINISSIYGLRGSINNLPYTVSKHGLSGLTKTICKDYAEFGITCNEICPGPIESELMDRIATRYENEKNIAKDVYLEDVRKSIPSKRMAYPEDISYAALFLSTEQASYINGESIVIDGGLIQ